MARYLAVRGERRRSHGEHAAAFIALSFRGPLRPVARAPADKHRNKGPITADFALQEHFLEVARSFGTDIMRRLSDACVEAAHLGVKIAAETKKPRTEGAVQPAAT